MPSRCRGDQYGANAFRGSRAIVEGRFSLDRAQVRALTLSEIGLDSVDMMRRQSNGCLPLTRHRWVLAHVVPQRDGSLS